MKKSIGDKDALWISMERSHKGYSFDNWIKSVPTSLHEYEVHTPWLLFEILFWSLLVICLGFRSLLGFLKHLFYFTFSLFSWYAIIAHNYRIRWYFDQRSVQSITIVSDFSVSWGSIVIEGCLQVVVWGRGRTDLVSLWSLSSIPLK